MPGDKFSNDNGVTAAVQCTVEPRGRSESHVIEVLGRLDRDDPTVLARYDGETKLGFIAASTNRSLRLGVERFRENFLDGDEVGVDVSGMQVCYRESCMGSCDSVMAKTANKHVKLYAKIKSINQDICQEMEAGGSDRTLVAGTSPQEIAEELDLIEEGDVVWSMVGSSLLVQGREVAEKGIPREHVLKRKVPMTGGFEWACAEGPLIGEPIRGCRFIVVDMAGPMGDITPMGLTYFSGQVFHATRKLCHGALLSAQPQLHEPIYRTMICSIPRNGYSDVLRILEGAGASVEDSDETGGETMTVSATMPARNSFGLDEAIRRGTGCGSISVGHNFLEWRTVPGDPFTEGDLCHDIVSGIRKRKGMPEIQEPKVDKLGKVRCGDGVVDVIDVSN